MAASVDSIVVSLVSNYGAVIFSASSRLILALKKNGIKC